MLKVIIPPSDLSWANVRDILRDNGFSVMTCVTINRGREIITSLDIFVPPILADDKAGEIRKIFPQYNVSYNSNTTTLSITKP